MHGIMAFMTHAVTPRPHSRVRVWIRRFFLTWAVVSTAWLVNSYRTQGVDATLLKSDTRIDVISESRSLRFIPRGARSASGLLFISGAGVSAEAYAPMLRPLAEEGHMVVIIRLPWRIAPLQSHKHTALERARAVMAESTGVTRWVLGGHSLGGALASQLALTPPPGTTALVLIATSHPKRFSLAGTSLAVTKVYGSRDGIATPEMIGATRYLLPDDTAMIPIEGANHSQFAHYGHQLMDGHSTISREEQQARTRSVLSAALSPIGHRPELPQHLD